MPTLDTLHAAPLLLAQNAGGYTPFIDPIDAHDAWWLTLIPLAFLISMAYKAVRSETLHGYWTNVLAMTAQIVLALLALAAALLLLVELIVPALGG